MSMRRAFALCVVAASAAFAGVMYVDASSSCDSENNIVAEGFESGTIDPSRWTTEGANLAVTTDNPHTGAYCLRMLGADHIGGGAILRSVPPFSASSADIDFHYRDIAFNFSGGGSRARFALDLYDDVGDYVGSVIERDGFGLSIFFIDGTETFAPSIQGMAGEWNQLSVRYASGGPARIEIEQNGTLVHTADSTGVYGPLGSVAFLCGGQVSNTAEVFIDDICIDAVPSITCPGNIEFELWPPNHQYRMIDLNEIGITTADGGPPTVVITSITQDELVNGHGDGNTVCDANGVGSSVALIRAERKGSGNGRVYEVSYTATDDRGGQCAGIVRVSVPKSRNGQPAMDDGQLYDSTEGCE